MPTSAVAHAAAPTCGTLWIGRDLGPISQACLASFVRHGHRVVLYCYDAPRDVPSGVEIADANTIAPSSAIFRHKESGSYALFSDLFRYELLRRVGGLWIDCDVYCVRPITLGNAYVYGWEGRQSINGAVLAIPNDSSVLEKLIEIFALKSPVLPWLPSEIRMELTARRLSGESFGLLDLPWGAAGPAALTYLLTEAGLTRYARPWPVFYPVPYQHGGLLLKSGFDVLTTVRPETLAIHLWNQALQNYLGRTQRGSAVYRLINEGTLFDETRIAATESA